VNKLDQGGVVRGKVTPEESCKGVRQGKGGGVQKGEPGCFERPYGKSQGGKPAKVKGVTPKKTGGKAAHVRGGKGNFSTWWKGRLQTSENSEKKRGRLDR